MEGVVRATVSAERRLGNPTTFYLHHASTPTDIALEKRLAHLRDDSGRADHHSTDGNQLVYVLWIQVSHAGHLFHAKWTNLYAKFNIKLNHIIDNFHKERH